MQEFYKTLSLARQVAFVTGGGSGIGRSVCRSFARLGAKVAVTDLNIASAQETKRLCVSDGADSTHVAALGLDVTDEAAMARVMSEVKERLGAISVLVNNAGVFRSAKLDDPAFEDVWQQSLDILVTAQIGAVRTCLKQLRSTDHPRIINIASTEALGATKGYAGYTAAKHAVVGLTRALAVELGSEGITVNCVCPGPIETGITADIGAAEKANFAKRRTVLERYGTAEEVAHMVVALAQSGASYVTGANIIVDGGLTVRNA